MLPLENLSVARMSHPGEAASGGAAAAGGPGQDRPRHPTLYPQLQRASRHLAGECQPLRAGDTVPGIVRSVRDYGVFVELTPNLSGLAQLREDLSPGDRVSVQIRSLRPERMKIKLQIVEKLPPREGPEPLPFVLTDGVLPRWRYSPPDYARPPVETVFFDAPAPSPEEPPGPPGLAGGGLADQSKAVFLPVKQYHFTGILP